MSGALQAKKRPGGSSNFPEPVHSNPKKGKAMNVHQASTGSMPKARDPMLGAFMDLQSAITDLSSMADIMALLLNRTLTDSRAPLGKPRPDNSWHINLSNYDMELISFAWVDVACRATALKDAYLAAFDARGGSHDGT